jgi:23S rRNA (adenine2030-N6)-methyltransferase
VKYRHSFHAGNFADVHKHVTLLALLQALQRKDKGFLYLDTHAGAGAYDLAEPSTRHGAEARGGITALAAAPAPATPELREYLRAVATWRGRLGNAHAYPGSAALAALTLRPQDRGLCCEWLPAECRALEHSLGVFRSVRVVCDDGYRTLAASLPCVERRALVLIDPPYESASEEIERALAAIGAALARMSNTVIALWYPIKDEDWLERWQQRAVRELPAPASTLELWLYPRDAGVALNGSGLLIVNPPYRIAQRAEEWQRELLGLLARATVGTGAGPGATAGAGATAGSTVRTLIAEGATRHVGG